MRQYNLEYCDGLDAAIFSGDDFIYPNARKELREYLARWERGLKEHDKTFPDGPLEEHEEESETLDPPDDSDDLPTIGYDGDF